MKLIESGEIPLIGSTFTAVAKAIVGFVPEPKDLIDRQLKLSWSEEAVLADKLKGMAWPTVLGDIIREIYKNEGKVPCSFGASLSFDKDNGGDYILLTFRDFSS